MIKGVNKSIIEVNDTGNEYFEKAVFYIKPQYANKSYSTLEKKAKTYIGSVRKNDPIESYDFAESIKKRRRLFMILGGYLVLLTAVILFFVFR